ncbi:hypothetical protein IC582_015554 [Cucumis melo]
MGESANTHQHTSPATVAPSAPPPNLALSRGPTWTPAEQLQQLHYCIHSNPSWPEAVLLAFQHYIVVLGTIVLIATTLVPRMGGSPADKARVIQTLLFTAGLNTLLQTALGSRLPTVMRSSFVFILPVLSIINDFSDKNFSSEHELANCVEIGLPMLILLVIGQQYLRRIHHRADVVLERFGLLICIALIWAFAAILTVAGAYNHVREVTKQSCRTDRSFLMSSAPWYLWITLNSVLYRVGGGTCLNTNIAISTGALCRIRVPYPFQWGTPIFRASHVFGMMGATLVASAESTGTFFAAARLSGATPPPSYIFNRSIGLQGIGLLVEGIFGCIAGNSASVENVGLLGLTHIGSRRVVQISTAFMIFFSIFGKFGAFFASIPLPIFGAIYCVLFGIVAATGISFMQFTNNNSMRNLYIIGLSLFLGISIPQYFVSNTSQDGRGPVQTAGGWVSQKREPLIIHSFLLLFVYPFNTNSFVMQFNDILNTIFSSAPTIAIIIGTVLDQTLDAKPSVNDRGVSWWKPFQHKKGDVRNDEFYGLPLRINKYIPTRFH